MHARVQLGLNCFIEHLVMGDFEIRFTHRLCPSIIPSFLPEIKSGTLEMGPLGV